MSLSDYVTLGRSGLRVSPLALGTMTFGTETGWGMQEAEALALFDHYLELGGNFFDCANNYAGGTSETLLGKFVEQRGVRDRAVIATKFTRSVERGNPNAVGNGRKAIYLSIEQSLRRLRTDYIDLYWMHSWDMVTPCEEVLETLDDLVRAGKIRYFGLSDVPAWYATRFQTLAEKEGRSRVIALQLEYSLIERSIEREHIPAAQEMGMALCPWGITAGGFLSGKYARGGGSLQGGGRLTSGSPGYQRGTERHWAVLDVVSAVAGKLGKTPAQVALNWLANRPGVTSPLMGVRSLTQLEETLSELDFALPKEMTTQLDEVSALEPVHPYLMFQPPTAQLLDGGVTTRKWLPERL